MEALKELADFVLGNSNTRVPHKKTDGIAFSIGPNGDTPSFGEFDGVPDEVGHYLVNAILVADDSLWQLW